MTIRLYDEQKKRWAYAQPAIYSSHSNTWVAPPMPTNHTDLVRPTVGAWQGQPYIGTGTVWQRSVKDMPLHANSANMAKWMAEHINAGSGWGPTGINTSLFGTPPIPVFIVDSTSPDCHYQYVDKVGRVDPGLASVYLTGKIPWPLEAKPVTYQDKSIAIWDAGTGIMREYFYMTENSPQHWEASAAGYSLAQPDFENLGSTNYSTQLRSGGSAVVCMHNELGFLDIAGLLDSTFDKNGLITSCGVKHALAFTCATMSNRGSSWPAAGSDGNSPDPNAPSEGQWSRFKSSVDPHYNPVTKKPYTKMEQIIIVAAQTYGQAATDRNMFVHAYNGESGEAWRLTYGVDPWLRNYESRDAAYDGDVVRHLGDANRDIRVGGIPWGETEWAPHHWGRPDIDFAPQMSQIGTYVKGR